MTLNLTADPERVKHLLITARDELQARGWTQGTYGTTDGPKCAVGAIGWASQGHPILEIGRDPAALDAEYALMHDLCVYGIPSWNDEPGRTAEEVLAQFDKAIGLVDAEITRRASVAQVQEIAHLAGIETQVTL